MNKQLSEKLVEIAYLMNAEAEKMSPREKTETTGPLKLSLYKSYKSFVRWSLQFSKLDQTGATCELSEKSLETAYLDALQNAFKRDTRRKAKARR